MTEIARDFRWQTDLDLGEVYPFDQVLAGYDPSAHFVDDSFQNRLAFAVLLNFPVTTLKERLEQGPAWSRRQWAEARLAERFSKRVPAEVNLAITQAGSTADHYIADYNIWMRHVVDAKGTRLFPPKMRLLTHWNLRDQIRADYSGGKNGLAKQRQIAQVMDRIVTQTIPQVVIDNPYVDWDPVANTVKASLERDSEKPAPPGMKVTNAPKAVRQPGPVTAPSVKVNDGDGRRNSLATGVGICPNGAAHAWTTCLSQLRLGKQNWCDNSFSTGRRCIRMCRSSPHTGSGCRTMPKRTSSWLWSGRQRSGAPP
jgi:hypothetical protein